MLRHLVGRAGSLVTREDLLQSIWRDIVVTDESITKCIADIRKALNDDVQKVIRTVARRGARAILRIAEWPQIGQSRRKRRLQRTIICSRRPLRVVRGSAR